MTEAGVVVVDKAAGVTSHDVVGRCRRIFGTRKVGHAGTLDPMATGVLVLISSACIATVIDRFQHASGHWTRRLPWLRQPKRSRWRRQTQPLQHRLPRPHRLRTHRQTRLLRQSSTMRASLLLQRLRHLPPKPRLPQSRR